MSLPSDFDKWIQDLQFMGLAAFAGLLGHLMRNANSRRKSTIRRSILEALSSGLVGLLTGLLCRAMGVSYEWGLFITGVLGWLGAAVSIQLFERIARRKLGIPDDSAADIKTGTD